MGLTTITDELIMLLKEHSPDIVVLTETKLIAAIEKRYFLRDIFKEYELKFSSGITFADCAKKRNELLTRKRKASGGVMLAIKKAWTQGSALTRLSDPETPDLKSHCIGMQLQPPESEPLIIWDI